MKKPTYRLPNMVPGKKVPYRKRRKWPYVLLSVFLVLALIFGGFFWFLKSFLPYEYVEIEKTPEVLGFEEVKDKRILNIALFGVDTRNANSFEGRSDTIIILSVNTATNQIKLISVMRDSLVPIEKDGKTEYKKINAAYSKGGPALAMKTLNVIFDLDISEFVSINFFKLADVIDMVGGVEVEVTQSEIAHINGNVGEIYNDLGKKNDTKPITKAGLQHLNGKQAVGYARIRYTSNAMGTNNDHGRTDRQRLIMEKLFKKALAMEKTEALKLVKPILKCCQSSLDYEEVIQVVMDVLSENSKIDQTRIPQINYQMTSPKLDGASYVYYDLNYAAKVIHGFIYKNISPKTYEEVYGIEKNDWYSKGFVRPKIEVDKN